MPPWRLIVGIGLSAALAASGRAAEPAPEPAPLTFEAHVRPILKAHCFHCHGEDGKAKGKLDLRLARLARKGGESGEAISPGRHGESLLWERVEADEMPPGEKKLSEKEKRTLADWIDQGARTARPEPESLGAGPVITEEERAFWSFRPVTRPEVPRPADAGRVRNPVDAFILQRLEVDGQTLGAEADRPTLIRRLSFDLTGLPPTADEVDAFVADRRPDAYERVVERLLASPAYGERWARHWMDVAGYADSDGYSLRDDVRPFAYKYRDYLIRSLNADRPWDELIREQLAGDEMRAPPYRDLSPADADRLIATGFLRMAPDGTADPEADRDAARNDVVAETIKVASTALLGLTVGCAQCHDHRYDPISQVDYYRFRAIFEPALDPANWRVPSGRLVSLWGEAERAKAREVDDEVKAIEAERSKEVDALVNRVLEAELAEAPEALRPKLREARAAGNRGRTVEQQRLVREFPRIVVSPGNVSLYDGKSHGEIMARFGKRIDAARAKRPADDAVHALTETPGHAPTTRLFERGDPKLPRDPIAPGELTVLTGEGSPEIPVDDPALPTTGRRLAYARHLTSGRHPLTARVLVNRVWMHHFGRGLVATPADFGALGEKPSHPQLLDWLADRFVADGWSLKTLHRLLVGSATYRQTSRRSPEADRVDPDNRLLARANVRRLEAEAVRDAILSVSGQLFGPLYGPALPVAPDDTGQVVIGTDARDSAGRPTGRNGKLGPAEFRRSLYVQVRRSLPLGLLDAFDAPAMSPNCERRDASTVAPQALLMLNHDAVLASADAFARRVERDAGDDVPARVRLAWRRAFGVSPSPDRVDEAARFLADQQAALAEAGQRDAGHLALASFCQALLGSNAFLYVD